MKKMKRWLATGVLAVLLLPSFFVFAGEVAQREVVPTPAPGQVVLEGAPTLPEPVPAAASALGIGLWCAVLLLLLAGLAYLVVNLIRQHKQSIAKDRLVRPKLIISVGRRPD